VLAGDAALLERQIRQARLFADMVGRRAGTKCAIRETGTCFEDLYCAVAFMLPAVAVSAHHGFGSFGSQ
jgi:hypothetical protein